MIRDGKARAFEAWAGQGQVEAELGSTQCPEAEPKDAVPSFPERGAAGQSVHERAPAAVGDERPQGFAGSYGDALKPGTLLFCVSFGFKRLYYIDPLWHGRVKLGGYDACLLDLQREGITVEHPDTTRGDVLWRHVHQPWRMGGAPVNVLSSHPI